MRFLGFYNKREKKGVLHFGEEKVQKEKKCIEKIARILAETLNLYKRALKTYLHLS